jgi:alkanesulfonate monooxygenase SsuD/methylene tetrahydromethanopterin reductase-like flavin-dependent oxidoreductase (luciferase family)
MAGMMAWLAQEEQARELVDWLDGSFPPGHPFAEVALLPDVAGGPEPWLLGASSTTATLAGRLGVGFCFAGFLDPDGAVAAFRAYRHVCAGGPRTMLAVNVACGPTDEEGDRLRASVELFWRRARERPDEVRREPLADPDDAVAELGGLPEPSRLDGDTWPRQLSGSPGRVRELLEEMAATTGVDELMLQDMIARPADRLRSYELIADVFDLVPHPQPKLRSKTRT